VDAGKKGSVSSVIGLGGGKVRLTCLPSWARLFSKSQTSFSILIYRLWILQRQWVRI
jgi:hypothetical protein